MSPRPLRGLQLCVGIVVDSGVSRNFRQGCSQSVTFLSVHSRAHIVCRIRLESIQARLSLTDKDIGTSARFYTYAYNTVKSHTKKLCIS